MIPFYHILNLSQVYNPVMIIGLLAEGRWFESNPSAKWQ